jgi:hypothetical protein
VIPKVLVIEVVETLPSFTIDHFKKIQLDLNATKINPSPPVVVEPKYTLSHVIP